MKQFLNTISIAAVFIGTTACGHTPLTTPAQALDPMEVPLADDSVVHGRAIYTVTGEQQSTLAKIWNHLWIGNAYAANGSTTVTYTNAASTNFTINVGAFAPGAPSGNTLSLGSVALASLTDNNLKVCGNSGLTKCTQAAIRVYTTGSTAGFVNTADAYGAPIYTGTLNPTTPVGLLAAGSVQTQTLAIASTKHTISISDFPTPTYAVSADFANAGAGSYSMTYVVEYVLLP